MRTFILLAALAAVACSQRNRVARQSEDVEGNAPVAIHPDIDHLVRYVKHSQERLPDGRLAIKVVLASRSGKDRALIAHSEWLDGNRMPLERSDSRSLLIPSGGTIVYEDTSFTPEAERFNVSIRPASTKRKR